MKKKFLNYNFKAASLGAKVVPGTFKITNPGSGKTNALLILNTQINDKLEDFGGWNFLFVEDATLKTSKKVNPLYNASETPSPRPEIPQYVPANFRTIKEALAALDAGKNIQNA